ncbi:SDR family oxidoreductase [Roseiterribacter gracilis]|uniref:Short-chain dehydrogenase n=1 Tax=Roseiterribacter gracilis TaxID=2812848 RepID=A0A8S8X904_9PROT|nr:short-chain dehydrogenase [Rhodospirillales bacterium TMPK1]
MKTILVTGANRGLGLEYARQYAADGWRVLAACRDPDNATELRALKVEPFALDVADPASIKAAAARLDGIKLDVLLHNAGVLEGWGKSLTETTRDEFERVLRVNLLGPFDITRTVLPCLGVGSKIAIMTSGMGSMTNIGSGKFYAYRTSKAAVNMLGTCLAHELGDRGIAVVLLHPGWVHTEMGGKDAPLDPQTSVRGLRQRINETTVANSGRFVAYDGQELPW